MHTGNRGTFGEEGLLDFGSFFGDEDTAGATVFFTSATRVVVPTDRETDGTGLIVTEAAGRCFRVTGWAPTHDTSVCVHTDVHWIGALVVPA